MADLYGPLRAANKDGIRKIIVWQETKNKIKFNCLIIIIIIIIIIEMMFIWYNLHKEYNLFFLVGTTSNTGMK